jgi:hypothetical protein
MSQEQIEWIQKEHEEAAVKEVLQAVPHMNNHEIRRLLKEHGDTNIVVELLTGEEHKMNGDQLDDGEDLLLRGPPSMIEEEDQDEPGTDALRMSIEFLSLETKPATPDVSESNHNPISLNERPASPPPPPSSHSNDASDPKSRGRQRRQASAARKERQTKRMQKEAAKRRKRTGTMGLNNENKELEDDKSQLKAIIV